MLNLDFEVIFENVFFMVFTSPNYENKLFFFSKKGKRTLSSGLIIIINPGRPHQLLISYIMLGIRMLVINELSTYVVTEIPNLVF